jgi:L-fuconolactonase
MLVIDCHEHFQDRVAYPPSFPPAVGDRLDRDFTPDDLRSSLVECGIDRTILVQLHNEIGETEDYLDLSESIHFIGGVVGWVPLTDPTRCVEALDRLSGRGRLVGIRHLISYEPNPAWLLQPPVLESLALLASANLAFEAIPLSDGQLDSVLEATRRLPDLRVVLNHMGNPPVPECGWEPWASKIAQAAELPNMSVKLSVGLAVAARWSWSTDALRRYADHVIDRFGPDRVMAGSNWPVILLSASFADAWRGIETLIAGLVDTERQAIMGATAQRIYRL